MTFLYIIQSLNFIDKFYLGISSRKDERFAEHNRGQTRTTKKYIPWEEIYVEEFLTKSEAMKRERFLKSIKGYKERLEIIKKFRKW